jgi:hypothetical protein
VSSLSEPEVFDLGESELPQGKRPILCRADFTVADIQKIGGLSVAPEPTTHPLHAIIINWPAAKDEQKLLTLELEMIATIVLPL